MISRKIKEYLTSGKYNFLWISFLLGVLFWIIDAFVDTFIFHEGPFITAVFNPSPREIWVHLPTFCIIFLMVYALFSTFKHKEIAKRLRVSEEKYRSVVENIGIGISVISPEMEILSLNGQMKKWFPDIDVSKKPVCYEAFNNPPRIDLCSYCPTCKTLTDGQIHESITDTPVGNEIRNYRVISSPIKNTEGKVIAAIEMADDITEQKKAEGTLRKSEEYLKLYQALINQSNDSVEVIDQETGHFLNVNNKTCADLGYSREELLSMKVFDIDPFVKPSDFPKIVEDLRRTGGSIWNGVHLRKDGSTFPVEVSLKLVQLDRSYLVAVARDMTGRKKAEEALRESEERYRNLFENAHDMIQSIAPDGHIMYVNPAWLKTMGFTRDELLHLTIFDVLHPDHKARCMETFNKVMSGESLDNIKVQFIAKDGRLVHAEGNASTHLLDGKVVACNGIFHDVTERKKMEEQIFQITHDWEDTFNTITDMITVHDKDFNIIHANKAAEKILGLPILNVSPSKCYLYYHGTGGPPEGCPSCECLKTGMPSVNEIYEPHLKMFIEIRAIPRFDSNHNLTGLIHVVRDITERRKLEDQLRQSQKMEAVGQLAGGIAHDFNNILTAVIGYANILKIRMDKDDPLKINLDHILSASDKGAHLTQSLLSFSRQQVTNLEPLDVNRTIRHIENLLLRLIGDNIELKMILNPSPAFSYDGDVVESADVTVMADRVQIDQVLMNLCTNARDAMPDGGILTIETGITELDKQFTAAYDYGKPGTYAVISVSDTGTGLDEKIKERIFEPFFTTKEVGKGTGLGLSIVYGIIRQHNGYITCSSEIGKGSTFRIYLPIIKSDVTETNPDALSEMQSKAATILLAEDELLVRELTKQGLENFGYNVIEAADGEEAVKRFIENRDTIDMIILDVIMPKLNGKEAYDKILRIKPGIKALMISGYPPDFIQKQEIIRQGIAFMTKPVSPAGLVKKVKEELAK